MQHTWAPESRGVNPWREAIELESRGQYRRARERFTDCLKTGDVDAADAHFHLGWCLEADGDGVAALPHYQRAASLAADPPLVANASYRAALLALGDGSLDQALSLLERTRTACASSAALRRLGLHAAYWLGVCHERDNRTIDALGLYAEAAQSDEARLRAEALYRQLQGLSSIGAFEAAVRVAGELSAAHDAGDEGVARLAALAAEERRALLIALKEA